MSAISHRPAAFELRTRVEKRERDAGAATQRLSLRATGDGWSLLAPNGQVLFRGFGLAGRRQCLEFARRLGALTVSS